MIVVLKLVTNMMHLRIRKVGISSPGNGAVTSTDKNGVSQPSPAWLRCVEARNVGSKFGLHNFQTLQGSRQMRGQGIHRGQVLPRRPEERGTQKLFEKHRTNSKESVAAFDGRNLVVICQALVQSIGEGGLACTKV